MNIFPVLKIERHNWGTKSTLWKFGDGVYIYTFLVTKTEKIYKTTHSFVYVSHFKQLVQPSFCGVLIDNINYAPIYGLDENSRDYKGDLKRALKIFFGGHCFLEVVYRVTPYEYKYCLY